jgi:hypothetical protein
MPSRKDWNDEDERPTNRGGKSSESRSDTDYLVGKLMVEGVNHRQRIEVLEARLRVVEIAAKNNSIAPGSSLPPAGKQRLYAIIRKTVTTTAIILAALFSALKELGFLGFLH